MRIADERAARRWDIVAVVGLAGWLLFDLTARTVFGSVPWPDSVVDYRIQYDAGRQVFETHTYPVGHPYPPPAMAFQASTTVFPYPTAAALWLGLVGLSAGAFYFTLARTLGLHGRPGLLVLLPLAHVVGAYYFQWDMRSVNCNLLFLAVVLFGCAALAAGRDRAAGFWFAASVALKLFPVLVLPYLAWTRRWGALGWAVVFSLVFWLVVPVVAFGADGFVPVYRAWAGEITRTTDPALKHSHPILISLDKATLHALAGDAGAAKLLSLAVCGAWVLVGLAGAASCWGDRRRDGARVLVQVSLLVIGPVAVSPYLEAYHLVPVVVPALVLLAAAADRDSSPRARALAASAFALAVIIAKVPNPWPLRGLVVNAQALVLCAAAVGAVWARADVPEGTDPRPELEGTRRGWLGVLVRRLVARTRA